MSRKVNPGQVVKINTGESVFKDTLYVLDLPGNTQFYSNLRSVYRWKKWIKISSIGIILRKITQEELFIKAFDKDERGELAILTNNDMIISFSACKSLLTSTFYEVLCGDTKIILIRNDFKKVYKK